MRIQHHVEDSDIVLTLKNYYRRQDSPVRVAELSGIPIEVLRSNTVSQIKGALARVYGVEAADPTDRPSRRHGRGSIGPGSSVPRWSSRRRTPTSGACSTNWSRSTRWSPAARVRNRTGTW